MYTYTEHLYVRLEVCMSLGRQMRGDFSNGPGRVRKRDMSFRYFGYYLSTPCIQASKIEKLTHKVMIFIHF